MTCGDIEVRSVRVKISGHKISFLVTKFEIWFYQILLSDQMLLDQIYSLWHFPFWKKLTYMCPKRVLSLYMFWTFPWSLDMFCVTYKKCPKCGHFPFWKNLSSMCPKKCPNFGHPVDIFWILLPCLDIFCAPNYKCPKCDQPELNVSIKCPKLGHIMDIFRTFPCSLDAFWT